MKNSRNNIWLLTLMIISQVMLAGLLAQWLMSQWEEEKRSFQDDLNVKFIESVDQVMDSMLVKHLIVPVMNDTSDRKDHMIMLNEKITPGNPEKHIAFFNDSIGKNHATVTITLPDSLNSQRTENAFGTIDSTRQNILIRSVRLIIRDTRDSAGEGNPMRHMISIMPDTNLLRELFETRLGKDKPVYNFRWINDSMKSIPKLNGPAFFSHLHYF